MRLSERGAFWLDVVLFAGISVIMYEIGFLSLLYLVPLQVMAKKRGENGLLFASLLVLAAVLVTAFIHTRAVEDVQVKNALIFLELVLPVMLVASLYTVNRQFSQKWRALYRLLGVTLAVGIVSVPIILIVKQNTKFVDYFRDQVAQVVEVFTGSLFLQSGVYEEGVVRSLFNPDRIMQTIKAVFFRNYLFSFFLMLTLNWRVGIGITRRFFGGTVPVLSRFVLPGKYIWVFLISWAGILADIFFGLQAVGYIVWNIGLISLFLYGLQGTGIIRHMLEASNLGRGVQTFLTMMIVFLLVVPGINILIIMGIPIFGVSEVWIHYRKPKRSDQS
jgi:hypothetical protein